MFPGLDYTLSAAGVNTFIRTTVKLLATCAKNVSLKITTFKDSSRFILAQMNSYTYGVIYIVNVQDDFHILVSS